MQSTIRILNRFQHITQKQLFIQKHFRGFGKYAKYERLANPRIKYSIEFRGWKKYMALAYNLGFFRFARYAFLSFICYRYWSYVWPFVKYTSITIGSTFFILFWLRFLFHRRFGQQMFDKYKFQLCSTRFEFIFQDMKYSQMPALKLSFLICKTWAKWLIFRPHRRWMASIQEFMLTYEPILHYIGDGYYNGIGIRPLFIEEQSHMKGYFKWFAHKPMKKDVHKDGKKVLDELSDNFNDYYAIIDIKFDGNLDTRVLNVHDIRMHVNPKYGGEILKFEELKLSVDENWNASQFEEIGRKRSNVGGSVRERPLSYKRVDQVKDADYSMKK